MLSHQWTRRRSPRVHGLLCQQHNRASSKNKRFTFWVCLASLKIRQAVEVLDKLSPVKHVATVRKSQVQHAMAEMLTSMLSHSVAVDEPRHVSF